MEERYISSSNVWAALGGFPRFPAPSDQPAPMHGCIDCGQPAPEDEPICWACECAGPVVNDELDNLKAAAERAAGLGYDTKKATDFLQADGLDWNQYYPEVDGYGLLTGRVIGYDEAGFIVVDDAAMVEADTLTRDEQRLVSEGRFPIWTRCICVVTQRRLNGHWQRDCPLNHGVATAD
jgi:hypothetical protein